MITQEEFKTLLSYEKGVDKYMDTLYDTLGIDVINSPIFTAYGWLLDKYIKEVTTEDGEEWLSWYIFENESPMIVTYEDGEKVDVTEPEDFYDWMLDQEYWRD